MSSEPFGRFMAWTALSIFSAVALTAHQTDDDSDDKSSEDKWVLSVTAISMSFAFFAVLAHFVAKDKFEGQPLEMGFSFLLLILWAGGLPVIMNPSNSLANREDAQDGSFVIDNTNLYFSSWGAFIANLFLVSSLAKDQGVADVSSASKKTTLWFLYFAASFVVMVSSSRFFESFCDDGSNTCKRTKYAIAIGAVGTVVAMILSFLSAREMIPLAIESAVSLFSLILYCFGVGYITFASGPGTSIGNLYFSTWGAFIVSLLLTAQCVRQMFFGEDTSAEPPEVSQTEVEAVPKV